ncbi:pyruvate kinase [Victivallis sp. Marseille-Q1083]|uniref:pyruvate kinase n=1 Tax=Victivallis sp. Marseille-Q1083 TaxID=2717288 RepID=UPI0015893D76|nr:pyruvate kinase [Victivallis sp. Marseille-Q1083]
MKRTKIVATISTMNCEVDFLRRLHAAGMDVARLNTAHMSLEDAALMVNNIRQVSDDIAIMIDTKGPNIRTCNLNDPLPVAKEAVVDVSSGTVAPGSGFQVNYNKFVDEIPAGSRIMIDDGEVELIVDRKVGRVLKCRALNDGTIRNHKSVNVPGVEMNMPALTARDREFIDFAIENKLDFIAHSFVRSRDDVMAVQSILDTSDSPIGIIAKIENRQGVNNLSSILDVAYGVMVARGDLGIEIPLEEIPLIQKHMIYECMRRRKPVITATQMLQSMENNPRPTRAEVSDVANAVFDGSDAVMLSGETAQGRYPVESVAMMTRILLETERTASKLFARIDEIEAPRDAVSAYLVKTALQSPSKLPIRAIICNTATGRSPRMCAAYRGSVPIYAFSYNPGVVRQLTLSYGVCPLHRDYQENFTDLVQVPVKRLLEDKKIDRDDLVVFLGRHSLTDQSSDFCSIVRPRELAIDEKEQ